MTAARSRRRNAAMPALAALVFAVQALLLAFSLGASAEPVLRDRFGNVLCATDAQGRHGTPFQPASEGHGGRLDCCTAGCPMADGAPAPSPGGTMPVAERLSGCRLPFALHEDAAGAQVPFSPRQAQAPPLFV